MGISAFEDKSIPPSPEEIAVMFVLGRKQFDASMKSPLSPKIKTIIENTKQYHDGRWFTMRDVSDNDLNDIFTLLKIKTSSEKKLELMFEKEKSDG